MVKRRRNEMIESVTIIFNRLVDQTQIPLQWRQAAIKSIYKEGGSKEKCQEMQRGIFITNVVSKAYEIVKKIHNEAVRSNMFIMQTTGKKNISTMDNIIVIHAIIDKVTEPQRQGHRNTNKFFADAEKSFGKLWLKRLPNRNGRDRAQ